MAERNLSARQQHWLATQVNRTGALPLELVLGSVNSEALSFDSVYWHKLGRFAENTPNCSLDGQRGAKRASRVASTSHGSKSCVISFMYATIPIYGAEYGNKSRLNGQHINLFLERFPPDGEGQCGTAHALDASIMLARLTDGISSSWSMHHPSRAQRNRLKMALNRTVHERFARVPMRERAAEAVFNAVRQWSWGETWSELSVLKLHL